MPTTRLDDALARAISIVPAGRWGVAVSGGADSVALLRLAVLQPHLQVHVIHLDHETREGASGDDAEFVRTLAEQLQVPANIAQRSKIKDDLSPSPGSPGEGGGEGYGDFERRTVFAEQNPPHASPLREYREKGQERNLPARYRLDRLRWYRVVVERFVLSGVLIAHHADDQAETVAQRLLRGRQPGGLRGMLPDTIVEGVRLLRPLLGVSRDTLRTFLRDLDQPWVEDVSNQSPEYQRNRVRHQIAQAPPLRSALLDLGDAATMLTEWLDRSSPELPEAFDAGVLASVPMPLARHAAARWLRDRGVPAEDLSRAVSARLITLATDFGGPPRADFPGKITVRRSRGRISAPPIRTKGPQQIEPISVNRSVGTGKKPGRPFD